MLKHIVQWNFKKDTTFREIDDITFKLLNLKKLDEVLDMTIYKSNCKSSTKDFCLIVTFLNKSNLDAYTKNPKHQEVVKLIQKSFTNRECFDVEL